MFIGEVTREKRQYELVETKHLWKLLKSNGLRGGNSGGNLDACVVSEDLEKKVSGVMNLDFDS